MTCARRAGVATRSARSPLELTRFGGHLSSEERKEVTMPRTRRPYSAEFRRRLRELVRGGQSPEELARKFEPSANAIRNWVVQAARDEGRRADGLTTDEKEEVRRLRREVRGCGRSGRSSEKPRPGSPRRPRRSRRGIRVRERPPGRP